MVIKTLIRRAIKQFNAFGIQGPGLYYSAYRLSQHAHELNAFTY
jgi:hypothetical protein